MAVSMRLPPPKRRRLAKPMAAFDVSDEDDPDDESPAQGSAQASATVALLMDDAALARSLQEQGAVLAEAERWNAALARFDEAVRRDPTLATAHDMRAQVLLQIGRYFESVQAAQTACTAAANWGEARLTLARAQCNLGEPVLALASMEDALRLGCDDVMEARAEEEHIEAKLLQAAIAAGGTCGPVEIAQLQREQTRAETGSQP
jgi:tetratricopeptide (TPR) repeat protein